VPEGQVFILRIIQPQSTNYSDELCTFFFSFCLTRLETMIGIQLRFICKTLTDWELWSSLNCLLK
jgi:hypothetical protein